MLSTLKVIFLLLFWIWNVEGVKRVMPDNDVSTNFTSDTKVTSDSGSESDQDELPCCTIGDDVFYSLVDALAKATSNDIINITSHVIVLSSIVTIEGLDNFTIIGHINSTTIQCNDIGAVKFVDCNNVTMEGINWERCGSKNKPAIGVYNSSGVAFENCLFIYSKGQAVVLSNISGIAYIKNCNFAHNNEHRSQGAAIYYLSSTAQSMILTDNNRFESNGPANSIVYIGTLNNKYPSHNYLQNSIIVNNCGVPIYISHTTLHLNGSVLFKGNEADNGGGIYSTSSTVTFDNNSNVSFSFNSAATSGGAIYQINSQVLFSGNSNVTFTNNSAANGYGGVFYSNTTSFISFTDHVTVVFINNFASVSAGGIYSSGLSNISFDGNSRVNFNNNSAEQFGGAMTLFGNASVSFGGSSIITFTKNRARLDGGAMYCYGNSIISSHESSTVKFYNNRVAYFGGAIQIFDYSHVTFQGNSFAIFTNNTARYGGAVFAYTNCTVSFDDFSMTTFIENTANGTGGALVALTNSNMSIMGNSTITFKKNKATNEGGAVHCNNLCNILINDNSNVTFSDNSAVKGGVVDIWVNSKLSIRGRSLVTFTNNTATDGGAVFCTTNSIISFHGNSTVKFYNNRAVNYGGAIHAATNSRVSFEDFTTITFTENTALRYGGAISFDNSIMRTKGKSNLTIIENSAIYGGAIHTSKSSSITFEDDSVVILAYNTATENGGALHLNDNFSIVLNIRSNITFDGNIADRYGGAIYAELSQEVNSIMNFNTIEIYLHNNTAPFGNNIYVHVPSSCDDQCLNNSIIVGSGQRQFVDYISTSPNKLVFFEPAMCIDNDDHTNCETYIVRNIMLGQKIAVNGCVWDYYNKQAAATQFSVSSSDKAHHIAGSEYVLISCDVLQRLSLTGDKVTEAENIPMNFTSHSGSQSDLKTIFEQLIVELSPCHPGFHYDNTTQRCICYSDNDIVSCIDSTSTIKEGYWFGVVDGRTTVTICPNSYCNFSCCKTTNEFYQLSPIRINQCLSNRSGTACGSCEEGYTLSFDSVDCVSVKKCTTGQTSLVVTLSMIYWIVIVILVFIMTYYHAGIGYLYAITYYYSVLDILLGERLYISAGLFTTVSIMSSIAKITPQFLGQLCFVKNLSGIDQQFIHYAHPLAVTIIVGIICLLARLSYRISTFVSRGIIHVICYLLLLSYTSVATTSLLLLRSLTFHNVDKVYSYLSPDIEYFQGRHLPYGIIAILCTLVIVIGLPLLLLLEPFLNCKINFTRIKPLLDQFQGCYKDKYRSFAGYYMTCRLVIILIIIVNSSNDNTTQYLLIIVNVILALIHVTLIPYSRTILNMFDGLILQLLIVVSMIPLIDSFDPDLLLAFTIILVILPLVAFMMMEIYLYKSKIKKITEYFVSPKQDNTNDNDEIPMREFVDTVIDDNSRRNAYICEM